MGRIPRRSGPVRLYPALPARGAGEKAVSVAVRSDSNRLGERPSTVLDDFKDDSLTLAEGSKDRAIQGPGLEEDLGAIVVADYDSGSCHRVVDLDDTLHQSGFLDFAGPNAGRADSRLAGIRTMANPDNLDIRQPATVVSLMGEADGFAVAGLLAAHFATI